MDTSGCAHSGGCLVKLPVMGLLRRGNHQAGGFGWPQISGLLAESPSGVRGFRCTALSDCWNRQAGDSISAHERALGGIGKRGGGFVVPRGGGSACWNYQAVVQFPIGIH